MLQTGRNTVLNVYYRMFHPVMHNVVLMRGDCSNELEKTAVNRGSASDRVPSLPTLTFDLDL